MLTMLTSPWFLGLGGLASLAFVWAGSARVGELRRLAEARRRLAPPAPEGVFSEALVAELPEPARRYFCHAIAPGTPLAPAVEIDFEVKIKLKKTAVDSPFMIHRMRELIVTGRGSVGTGKQLSGRLPVTASYWYVDGQAKIREAAFGLVPTVRSSGENAAKVMRSRILNDYLLNPAALLPTSGAVWRGTDDPDRAQVTVTMDGQELELELAVDTEGRLVEAVAQRWGSVGVEGRRFRDIPFGIEVDEEHAFGGYTLPIQMRSGWWFGTDRYVESILVTILDARFPGVDIIRAPN